MFQKPLLNFGQLASFSMLLLSSSFNVFLWTKKYQLNHSFYNMGVLIFFYSAILFCVAVIGSDVLKRWNASQRTMTTLPGQDP